MKTLDFMNIKTQPLTREEMRNVMAGCGGSGDCASDTCLVCDTPGGQESWYRTDTTIDPNSACDDIYPGYNSGSVSGGYGVCGGGSSVHC
jgi:DnaJ-class molecular chaperone